MALAVLAVYYASKKVNLSKTLTYASSEKMQLNWATNNLTPGNSLYTVKLYLKERYQCLDITDRKSVV